VTFLKNLNFPHEGKVYSKGEHVRLIFYKMIHDNRLLFHIVKENSFLQQCHLWTVLETAEKWKWKWKKTVDVSTVSTKVGVSSVKMA
jgi:hypothetical protein